MARRPSAETVLMGREGGLGTFAGVFTPSILTILGVIMYLRFGWVVGHVGMAKTLIIVTLSTSITLLTTLSISAIATDQRIRVGGAYYMISRSMGIETGGAVGIPLYLAQALSASLYVVGFAESMVRVFPSLDQRWVGTATLVLLTLLALKSARIALRSQYFIMAGIAVSLVSFALGHSVTPAESGGLAPPVAGSVGFWTVFAVFFPAVTGIMAGVNMSGDLENPARSIPRGTLAAVGVGYLIYMALPILLTARASPATLVSDPLVMRRMALWGDGILLGVWGATLSSAVGSMLGAPRVLQALARDGVLSERLMWMGRGSGDNDEPRLGTLVTLGVAMAAVWLGSLNVIAPVLTMFFLTTYGVLNVAAGMERFLGSPSFRPSFRVHWLLSLAGALGCVIVMFLINAVATVVAIVFVALIFIWLERREMTSAWGDIRRGIWMALTRSGLLRLREPADPKNWRPHLLVLSGAPTRRWHLIDLARCLTHDRGLITVATVLARDSVTTERQVSMEATIQDYLEKRGVSALVRVVPADSPFEGARSLVEVYGLGSLVPNTIILGDSQQEETRKEFTELTGVFRKAQRNVLIVRADSDREYGERKVIHVWWGGLQRNGGLMMVLAYLLKTSLPWRGADVHVKTVVPNEAAASGTRENLERIIGATRTGSHAEVIVSGGRPFRDILIETSAGADLVFLGLGRARPDYETYYDDLRTLTEGLGATVFVLAAENLEFGEVLLETEFIATGGQ